MKKKVRSVLVCVCAIMLCASFLVGCGSSDTNKEQKQVIIYSNSDKEAVMSMQKTLDANGYKGKYIIQSFGTSELGGRIFAEGKNIEADVITISSYYLDTAQRAQKMFKKITFPLNTIETFSDFYVPFIGNQGAIFVNTKVLEEKNLKRPVSIKDLAKSEYANSISVADIKASSTAWLMVQALVSAYGEDGAKSVLIDMYKNAGAHLEKSGSAPIKKVRAGEVAIGFGLRHQAVADKAAGLPIDFVDPTEGNFTLTESFAVVEKGDKTNPLAMEMVKCIVEKGRKDLMINYPVPLYKGETANANSLSANSKVFAEPLTVKLLEKHQALSESSKK